MQTNGVSYGGSNAHPVPRVFLVVWSFVVIRKKQQRLHERHSVLFVIEVIQQLLRVN